MYEDEEKGKKSVLSKKFPLGRFRYIPNGCPSLETRLPLALSAGKLTPQKFVEVTATNAAKLYGLYPCKGALVPGISDADLTIWYPPKGHPKAFQPFKLTNSMLHHNVDYTPYEGQMVDQWPRYTILRDEVVWDRENGGVVGKNGYGQFVERGFSCLAGSKGEGEGDDDAF